MEDAVIIDKFEHKALQDTKDGMVDIVNFLIHNSTTKIKPEEHSESCVPLVIKRLEEYDMMIARAERLGEVFNQIDIINKFLSQDEPIGDVDVPYKDHEIGAMIIAKINERVEREVAKVRQTEQ